MGYDDVRKRYDPLGQFANEPDDVFLKRVADAHIGEGDTSGDAAAPVRGMPPGVNAAITMARLGGPGKAIAGIPARGIKTAQELFRGIGPAMGGALHAVLLAPRLAVHDPSAGYEATQAARAIGTAAPEVLKGMAQQAGREVANPMGSFIAHPLETTLDATMLADIPHLGLKAGAGIAARAGAKDAAMGLMRGAEGLRPAAVAGRAIQSTGEVVPAVGAALKRREDIKTLRQLLANTEKEAAQTTEQVSRELAKASSGVPGTKRRLVRKTSGFPLGIESIPGERETILPELLGTGSNFNLSEKGQRLSDYARKYFAGAEAKAIDEGSLTPRVAAIRRDQPLRIAIGGEDQLKYESAPRKEYNVSGLEKRARAAEKLGKSARKKGIVAAVKESEAARLGAALKQSNVETAALIAAEKKAARFAGRSEQAQKGLKPLEWVVNPERSRLARQATDVTKAEMGLESAKDAALASKAAIPGLPVSLARKLGKTEAQLSEAERWQKAATTLENRAAKLTGEANAKRGRIPALERLERQSAMSKVLLPDANPSYVPALAPRGERAREALAQVMAKTPTATKPGFLQRSSGARLASGEMTKDVPEIIARHSKASATYHKLVSQLDQVASRFGRPVTALKDVDWTKEALIAPEHFKKAIGGGVEGVERALMEPDAGASLARQAQGAVVGSAGEGEGMGGKLFAVPKHIAKELRAQNSQLPDYLKVPLSVAFDRPNDYLRWTALALRPGFYVNNVVGNVGLGALSGLNVPGIKAAIKEEAPAYVKGSGYASAEVPSASRVGNVLGKAAEKMRQANEAVDDFMRHASFRSEIERQVQTKAIKETGARLSKEMTAAEKLAQSDPEAALRHVNLFLNDYTNQTPFQKQVLRRVFPFQSFTLHMGKLAAKLPFKHPMRANVTERLAQLGNEYQKEQFRGSGFDPEKVPSYRLSQLPVRGTDTGMVSFGVGGLNPLSGFGSPEDAGLASTARGFVQAQAGPTTQGLLAMLTGKKPIGTPYTKPGFRPTHYGSDEYTNPEGETVGPPTPSIIDLLRQATPQVGLAERLAQPNETFDLVGDPSLWPEGYLPSRFYPPRPRRYGFKEALAAYLGVPYRDFTREEIQK